MIHISNKRVLCIFLALLLSGFVNAQNEKWVNDQENIFTTEEVARIDSILQAYHHTSGNLIVVWSDTMDVSTDLYKDKLDSIFLADTSYKPKTIYILFSRKTGQVNVKGTYLKGLKKWEELLPILEAGLGAIRDKRLEEGAMLMSRKAMEYLDALPDE